MGISDVTKRVNKGRNFLYSTPTKIIEFLMSMCSLSFGTVYLLNGAALNKLKIYLSFAYIGPIWLWWVMIILGVLQFHYMRKDTLDSNIKSALVMHVVAVMWFIIAVMFLTDYPPLSTGFFTYFWFSVVCSLTALELDSQNTMELLLRKEIKDV